MIKEILARINEIINFFIGLFNLGFLSPEALAAIIEQILSGNWMVSFISLGSFSTLADKNFEDFYFITSQLISFMDKSGGETILDLNPPTSPPPSVVMPDVSPSPPNSPPPWLNPSPPAPPLPPLDQGETELLQLYILVGLCLFVGEYMRQLWIKETRIAKEEEEKRLKEQEDFHDKHSHSDNGNDVGE